MFCYETLQVTKFDKEVGYAGLHLPAAPLNFEGPNDGDAGPFKILRFKLVDYRRLNRTGQRALK